MMFTALPLCRPNRCPTRGPTRVLAAVTLCVALAGCADIPDLARDPARAGGSATTARAAYPVLVPLGPLLAGLGPGVIATSDPQGEIAARVAALRARAAALRALDL